jgi:hypothetical protein
VASGDRAIEGQRTLRRWTGEGARRSAICLLLAYRADQSVAVSALGTECYTWLERARQPTRNARNLELLTS